jgi:RNA polymerase sigma factor (TIGR02999 family)
VPPESDPKTITVLLHRCRDGDEESFDELVPVVYEDLRRIARGQLARWRPGQTLNTTALVHESYAKLARSAELDWSDRGHFFAVAARAMRGIIVDYARGLFADKRTGIRADIDLAQLPDDGPARAEQVLAVDQLLERLEQLDEQMARVVECRFFAAYTLDETAQALNISRRTVQRKWQRARAWLAALGKESPNE